MSEILLEALMQLFALLTDVKKSRDAGRSKVEEFLSRQFNSEYVNKFLQRYDFYIDSFHRNTFSNDNSIRKQQSSDNMNKLIEICNQLNRRSNSEAKILLLSSLLNYYSKPDIKREEEHLSIRWPNTCEYSKRLLETKIVCTSRATQRSDKRSFAYQWHSRQRPSRH